MSDAPTVTRFAPSPTGALHIGSARTALFNWLYARATGGTFLLRIEDTDRARSTPENTQQLIDGLTWLGLDWDGEPISQFERAPRHREIAQEMLASGAAYKCFSSPEEINAWREAAKAEGNYAPFPSPWRDADPSTYPDAPYAIRLKTPREGGVQIKDKVQKKVSWKASEFDDLILLRSDGTPTYMLAVVVDDHDMGVTHIIRGDDHLINAGRQSLIYRALGWDIPVFAHIPLIHGEDGKKLSKRHGATGIEEFAALGYPPAAMRNYLARLGWSHGNDELFSDAQAKEWFGFDGMGKAPARLDMKKLDNVASHHIKSNPAAVTVADIQNWQRFNNAPELPPEQAEKLTKAIPALTDRAKNLGSVLSNAQFLFVERPLKLDEAAKEKLNSVSNSILNKLTNLFVDASWSSESLLQLTRDFADANDLKLGEVAQPLKAALSGRVQGPSAFDMMVLLGRDETVARLLDQFSSS